MDVYERRKFDTGEGTDQLRNEPFRKGLGVWSSLRCTREPVLTSNITMYEILGTPPSDTNGSGDLEVG